MNIALPYTLLLLSIACSLASTIRPTAQFNRTYNRTDSNVKYVIYDAQMKWFEVRKFCEEENGQLVQPKSLKVWQDIRGLMLFSCKCSYCKRRND